MVVYLVLCGSKIEAAFSTKSLATKYSEEFEKVENFSVARIEERELDTKTDLIALNCWEATIMCRTGTMKTPYHSIKFGKEGQERTEGEYYNLHDKRHHFRVRSYVSAEHAKGLAVRGRKEWLANANKESKNE